LATSQEGLSFIKLVYDHPVLLIAERSLFLFKVDESYVDLESNYALGRHVSDCPSTKFTVGIPLKTQALPATATTR
jgi:hypothetical protein